MSNDLALAARCTIEAKEIEDLSHEDINVYAFTIYVSRTNGLQLGSDLDVTVLFRYNCRSTDEPVRSLMVDAMSATNPPRRFW